MRLKEKTHRKFVDFFEKMSKLYQGNEFELAYSDIQRETGAASVTLKRAILALEDDGLIKVSPGRNSRYARFKYLADNHSSDLSNNSVVQKPEEDIDTEKSFESIVFDVAELNHMVDHLRRRIRTQEMTIALLQDRLAELEDKLHKH